MSRSARKRAVEEPDPIDLNDDDDDDDDDDDESDSADMEEDEEEIMDEDEQEGEQEEPQDQQLVIGSPSPAGKKDMTLRSGRRKRRRSKETSGMTPPELKKPRTGRKSSKKEAEAPLAITENGHGNASLTEDNEMEEETNNNNNIHIHVDQDENEDAAVRVDEDEDASNGATKKSGRVSFGPTQRSGRVSLLDSDLKALVAAQDPEQSVILEESPRDEPDSNRRLFDGTPPAMPVESVSPAATGTAMEDTAPVVVPPVLKNYTNGEHEAMDISEPPSGLPLRILFMMAFSLLFFTIWPLCVKLADVAIPLKELPIPDDAALVEAPVVVTKNESSQVIPESIFQGLRNLEAVQGMAHEKQTKIRDASQGLALELVEIQTILKDKEVELESRSKVLSEAQFALSEALTNDDLTSTTWQAARQATESLGRKVLDTPSVHLWQVATPEECPEVTVAEVNPEDTHNPIVAPHVVEEQFSGLLLRARMSADKLIDSPESEQKVREWARIQIQRALGGNAEASEAIAKLASPAEEGGGHGLPDLEELFQELLEVERADRTGEYDHASILNGAQVIYGGKRGTTKSMVDNLPLYNRLMQLAQLRFYGYGPEAAITPTYPPDALGQCWSFQQTPLKDVLKRRRSSKVDKNSGDDHKRGNFGTLTISLPLPVKVHSVVLEHPPQGLTDQVSSAIRSFRIIGYTDRLATEKSWSLGSFEYSSEEKSPLQEFEVATDISGTPVPPLQSITLAIDSNWGFDYSCLYRFRVHGEESEDSEEDSIFR